MSCKYNNCKHCGYKSECEIYKENTDLEKHNEKLIALLNAERERQEKCDDVHLQKIAELEKELEWERDTKTELAEHLGKANDKVVDLEDKLANADYQLEGRDVTIKELEAQLKSISLKIIYCIKSHLCKQDEDYDKPIISPKFLSDILDQMAIDGFEEIKEK